MLLRSFFNGPLTGRIPKVLTYSRDPADRTVRGPGVLEPDERCLTRGRFRVLVMLEQAGGNKFGQESFGMIVHEVPASGVFDEKVSDEGAMDPTTMVDSPEDAGLYLGEETPEERTGSTPGGLTHP